MKKSVDYLYLKWSADKLKRIRVKEYNAAGIKVLEVQSAIPKAWQSEESRFKAGKFERWKRRLKRAIRSYEVSSCAVNGDERVLQALQIENIGFLARKNELFLNGTYIFEHLALRKMTGEREKLLIYLESENWKSQEIKDLLWIAKDYYEDIVLAGNNVAAYEDIMTQLFEDCGLVVSTVDLKNAEMKAYDGVFFLVEKWNFSYMKKICFQRAYAVAEYEESDNVCRRMVTGKAVTEKPVCFSGLCYEWNGKKISYPLAVDLYFQNPAFCDKKDISFVAIYRLECYNNK
ncbi:MAG: hypothetical protein K2L07_07380 [Lachnospiraceae bacterium]|nr:hypothetical protein [Lachnospiraceae bacterium]